jgi:hypothetical protein
VSLGNDVVDLDDAEARLDGLHPRWTDRVFTAAERAAIAASDEPRRLHWALWAAKESAYKALVRRDAGAAFSPRAFAVELASLPAQGVARGRVVHRGCDAFSLEVEADEGFVHALARPEGSAGGVLSRVALAEGPAGAAVRELAAGAIGSSLELVSGLLRIEGRPPAAVWPAGRLDVSLSHHGRFVAFACSLPGTERGGSGPSQNEATRPIRNVRGGEGWVWTSSTPSSGSPGRRDA